MDEIPKLIIMTQRIVLNVIKAGIKPRAIVTVIVTVVSKVISWIQIQHGSCSLNRLFHRHLLFINFTLLHFNLKLSPGTGSSSPTAVVAEAVKSYLE